MKCKLLALFFCVILFCSIFALSLNAQEAVYNDCDIGAVGLKNYEKLFDSNRNTYEKAGLGSSLTLEREEGIAHLYIEFDAIPEKWTLTDTDSDKSIICGENSFLHEYINVTELFKTASNSLKLEFPEGVIIADIYAFSDGELPDWVQIWDAPCREADLMLISSHSDDEQLFFAGVLPYYAIERKLSVQVVYIVQHFEVYGVRNHQRPHEQLDGLWTVGVRNYPVMSDFPDVYSESADREAAFAAAQKAFGAEGVTYDDFCAYITECIRRFKPLVAVSHDLNGEYGHGTHVFCASALTEAIGFAADKTKYTESFEKYGTWEVEKTYLHLYKENTIVMDWDTPYESMGGKTPFQMTQEGFERHVSQHYTWFNNWLNGNGMITKASQIKYYSPCEYGLYDSKVGADVTGGDFMENIIPYAQRQEEKKAGDSESSEAVTYDSATVFDTTEAKTDSVNIQKESDNKLLPTVITACFLVLIILLLIVLLVKKQYRRKL